MSIDDSADDGGPTSTLDRTFAVMLGELEDAETDLTQRQAALARELADVEAELQRLAAVKSAMLGTRRRSAGAGSARPRNVRNVDTPAKNRRGAGAEAKAQRVLAWAATLDDGFRPHDASEMLGSSVKGVASLLIGMVRRGELVRSGGPGKYRYHLPDA